jgi:hypothetical protein
MMHQNAGVDDKDKDALPSNQLKQKKHDNNIDYHLHFGNHINSRCN